MPQQSIPSSEKLRHRGRRRAEFTIGGLLIGSMIGLAGWVVQHHGFDIRRSTIVAVVALGLAGALGGLILGALLVVEIEDGENEKLDRTARESGDPGAVIDETDVQDDAGRAGRATVSAGGSGAPTETPSGRAAAP
jgi:VIT1/CCC1 family predicted Fe2+/Mn2+ transporter